MPSQIYIVSTGARTPVGIGSAPSAAAVRAQISGIGTHPFMVDQVGDLMPGALDPLIDPELMGPQRLVALAEGALRETCQPLSTRSITPTLQVPIFLGLPELRPGFCERDAEEVRDGILDIEELPAEISEVNIFYDGHASGFVALKKAAERIEHRGVDACLVGGVESYFHPDTMEWLDGNRQLVGAVSRSGFAPGEGAGFILLFSNAGRLRFGFNAVGQMLSTATSTETKLIKTDETCFGEGLTDAVQQAVGFLSPPDETIDDIICDINSERYRGDEWGFVALRLPQYFHDITSYSSPADCWGDMGAASVPLFAVLACQAFERGYGKGPRVLLWASSEGGLRGASVLGFNHTKKKGKTSRHG